MVVDVLEGGCEMGIGDGGDASFIEVIAGGEDVMGVVSGFGEGAGDGIG